MRNKTYLIITVFLFSCFQLLGYHKPTVNDRVLTVIINNSSSNPILISSGRSYLKLIDYQVISHKKKDTVQLSLNGTEFIWFSHKGVLKDTSMVSVGDTLILNSTATTLKSTVRYKDATFTQRLSLYEKFMKNSTSASLQGRIDSLRNLFYGINKTIKETEFFSDFEKNSMAPLKVDHSFYGKNKLAFALLINSLEEQYIKNTGFLYGNKDALGNDLYNALLYQLHDKYMFQHKLLYRMFNNKSVIDTTYSKAITKNDLLKNPYSTNILMTYLEDIIIKKKPDFSKSRLYLDYKEAYDGTPDSLDNDLQKYCRFICIENMVEFGESTKDVSRYYSDFKIRYKDPRLNSILEKKYQFDIQAGINSENDVKLISTAQSVNSLDKIIKGSIGKLIYIDFWASWCAPCRDAMPASRKLAEAFKEKKIIFVYLSTDKNNDDWLKAAKLEELDKVVHSYRILNIESAKFLKDVKLGPIPRYLLFDKTGKLLYADAPGPASKELTTILTKNL